MTSKSSSKTGKSARKPPPKHFGGGDGGSIMSELGVTQSMDFVAQFSKTQEKDTSSTLTRSTALTAVARAVRAASVAGADPKTRAAGGVEQADKVDKAGPVQLGVEAGVKERRLKVRDNCRRDNVGKFGLFALGHRHGDAHHAVVAVELHRHVRILDKSLAAR